MRNLACENWSVKVFVRVPTPPLTRGEAQHKRLVVCASRQSDEFAKQFRLKCFVRLEGALRLRLTAPGVRGGAHSSP